MLVAMHAAAKVGQNATFIEFLTAELATAGSTPEQTFGYSADKLERAGVHLVVARAGTGGAVLMRYRGVANALWRPLDPDRR